MLQIPAVGVMQANGQLERLSEAPATRLGLHKPLQFVWYREELVHGGSLKIFLAEQQT